MGTLAVTVQKVSNVEKAKLITAFFLASEFVFFVFLILAYVDFQNNAISAGPRATSHLHPGNMGVYTAFLLGSSPTMWLASRAYRKADRRWFQIWLAVTIVFGAIFLVGEALEYNDLITKGVNLGTNLFGTTFFTLTGFHAFHLFIGLCLMSIILGISRTQPMQHPTEHAAVESVSMYWHFVDAMWVFIFSVVYLWSALG